MEEFSIAEGKVVCTDIPKYAFAELNDPAANEEIKAGTIVKLKYDLFALFSGSGLPAGLGDCSLVESEDGKDKKPKPMGPPGGKPGLVE